MTTKLRQERIKLDLRQSDLGEMLGVAQCTIAHWEAGYSRPNWTRRRKLEEVFKLPHGGALELLEEETTGMSAGGH